MAADIAPPTDGEVEAIHRGMIGLPMSGDLAWRRAIRDAIERFLAMRAASASIPSEPDASGWRSPEMAAAACRMGME